MLTSPIDANLFRDAFLQAQKDNAALFQTAGPSDSKDDESDGDDGDDEEKEDAKEAAEGEKAAA